MQPTTTTASEMMMILPKTQWLHHNNKDHRQESEEKGDFYSFPLSLSCSIPLLFILTFSSFMFSMVIQSTLSLTQLLVKVSALSQCSSSSPFIPMIITISPEKRCPSNIILFLPHSLSHSLCLVTKESEMSKEMEDRHSMCSGSV